jgi:hypothetical protein
MRDIVAQPYSADEARVAKFFFDHCHVGGGDDPIGAIIASHEVLALDRSLLRAILQEALDHLRHWCKCDPSSGCRSAILRDRIARALQLDHGLALRDVDPATVATGLEEAANEAGRQA